MSAAVDAHTMTDVEYHAVVERAVAGFEPGVPYPVEGGRTFTLRRGRGLWFVVGFDDGTLTQIHLD